MKLKITIFLTFFTISLFAHGGGTDRKGGHHDRRNGRYHFHHGHGPHQHPDGTCELSNNSIDRTYTPNKLVSPTNNNDNDSNTSLWVVSILGLGAGYLIRNRQNK